MDQITITKEEFMEKAADTTKLIIEDMDSKGSNSAMFILTTAIFTAELAKLLFDREIQ